MHEHETIYKCVKGPDCFPFAIVWAEAQSGGIHLPVRHRHVRTPVLSRKLEGLWRKAFEMLYFYQLGYESKKKIEMYFSLHRNLFCRKLPSLMFCPTSSITPIKSSAWLPWRSEQSQIVFMSLDYGTLYVPTSSLWLAGVCAASLHRLWAEQHSASPAAGWDVCCWFPVHAAIIASKQVMGFRRFATLTKTLSAGGRHTWHISRDKSVSCPRWPVNLCRNNWMANSECRLVFPSGY